MCVCVQHSRHKWADDDCTKERLDMKIWCRLARPYAMVIRPLMRALLSTYDICISECTHICTYVFIYAHSRYIYRYTSIYIYVFIKK